MSHFKLIILGLSILFAALFSSCSDSNDEAERKKEVIYITVSKDPKMVFKKWLGDSKTKDDSLVFINMYGAFEADSFDYWLEKSDGIIISGGEDINPALYGQPEDTSRCGTIDPLRDSLEMVMINYAYNEKVPLLGVCRGHQILNVAFGGSLIVDIPEDFGSTEMHRNNGSTMHKISVNETSYLYSFLGSTSGTVYSNHHQAVSRLAEGFEVSSYAPDGIPESIELQDTTKHPFILGVQWHPEAMDYKHPFSARIAEKFLEKIRYLPLLEEE